MEYQIDYKLGYHLNINNIESFDKYFVVIGDEIPRYRYLLGNNHWVRLDFLYYIEYQTYIYGWNYDKGVTLLRKEVFDLNDKNVLFDLFPRNEEDLDIWVNYINNFCDMKNCNPLFRLNEFNNDKFNINKFDGQDYYVLYNVSWDDNIHKNPKGIDMNAYQLINNLFLK